MSPRFVYLVLPSSHSLFPNADYTRLSHRVAAIVRAVERQTGIKLPPIDFDIRSLNTGLRSPESTLRDIDTGPEGDARRKQVRVVFSKDPVRDEAMASYFPGTPLLAHVEEADGAIAGIVESSDQGATCRIRVADSHSRRAIEDVMVDVCLGNYFRTTAPFADIVAAETLAGLFRRKAKFCRARLARSWLAEIHSDARYAMLSALNSCRDDDIVGRARAAYEAWLAFANSMATGRLAGSVTAAPMTANSRPSFQTLNQYGQLSPKRISRTIAVLRPGTYLLVRLTGSRARKTPEIKDDMAAVFGPRARRNKTIILPAGHFSAYDTPLTRLRDAGLIDIQRIVVPDPTGGEGG